MATILVKWRAESLPKRPDGHDPCEMARRIAPEAARDRERANRGTGRAQRGSERVQKELRERPEKAHRGTERAHSGPQRRRETPEITQNGRLGLAPACSLVPFPVTSE